MQREKIKKRKYKDGMTKKGKLGKGKKEKGWEIRKGRKIRIVNEKEK